MRTFNERIKWFREHNPSAVGQCLHHTWEATQIPATGTADANLGVALVRKNGKMHTDRNPPRGAWVWWTSSTHGHVCLSLGDGQILSTDVHGPATVGVVSLRYIEDVWHHNYAGWSKWFGVSFPVAQTKAQKKNVITRAIQGLRDRIHKLRRKRDHL